MYISVNMDVKRSVYNTIPLVPKIVVFKQILKFHESIYGEYEGVGFMRVGFEVRYFRGG